MTRGASAGDSTLDEEDRKVRRDDQRAAAALLEAGIRVRSVWDLVNISESYPTAIPILVRLLSEDLHWRVKEGVVRALAVKEARGMAAKPLVQEFLRAHIPDEPGQTELYKWAIGNTLSEVADDIVFPDLTAIVRDKRHGSAREMVAVALCRMKNPEAVGVLMDC